MKSRPAKPKKTSDVSALEPTLTAMRLRVYPAKEQSGRAAQWVYIRHHFRNHAVSFLSDRRKARGKWIHENPELFQANGVGGPATMPMRAHDG